MKFQSYSAFNESSGSGVWRVIRLCRVKPSDRLNWGWYLIGYVTASVGAPPQKTYQVYVTKGFDTTQEEAMRTMTKYDDAWKEAYDIQWDPGGEPDAEKGKLNVDFDIFDTHHMEWAKESSNSSDHFANEFNPLKPKLREAIFDLFTVENFRKMGLGKETITKEIFSKRGTMASKKFGF